MSENADQAKHAKGNPLTPAGFAVRMALALAAYALMLFLPAGTLAYVPGWIFLGVIVPLGTGAGIYLFRNHPALVERRMRYREKEGQQRVIIAAMTVVYVGGIVLCGLDYRWGWSQVPLSAVIAANVVVGLSYLGVCWVMVINEFAGRTIEVEEDQTVVDTGPYAVVRHPMYSLVLVFTLALPVGLGSYWALALFAVAIPVALHFRMVNEEKVLLEELDGYDEYRKKVRWRVMPYLW